MFRYINVNKNKFEMYEGKIEPTTLYAITLLWQHGRQNLFLYLYLSKAVKIGVR